MTRSPTSAALHEGFEQHVLPVLAPLGFVRVAAAAPAVGWTLLAAECELPSGARVRAELGSSGTSPPRFQLVGPAGAIELTCTETDPAYPKHPTVSHALSAFETVADARQGEAQQADRRRLALEFLAAEIAATSDQLVRAVPELGPRVLAARDAPAWRDAAVRARTLWANRNIRSQLEDRPVTGKFTFVGTGLAVVEAEGRRFTFRFDTSKLQRAHAPVVTGWWTTPAGTKQPSQLVVGDLRLRFDPTGTLTSS